MTFEQQMGFWWAKIAVELIWAGIVLAIVVVSAFVKVYIIDARRDRRNRRK